MGPGWGCSLYLLSFSSPSTMFLLSFFFTTFLCILRPLLLCLTRVPTFYIVSLQPLSGEGVFP